MSIARDLSSLPRETRGEEGVTPDPEPAFLAAYFAHLTARNEAEGERPHAVEGTRFRHSMAGSCARAVAYHALKVPESNPMDLAGIMVTSNGTAKHDEIQEVLCEQLSPDVFQVEVPCQIEGFDGSGTADGLLELWESDELHKRVVWEHKNVGGFAFKQAIGERGPAQGPRRSAIIQGALNALALDADELVITLMTFEAVSVNIAKRKNLTEQGRIAAQWTFARDEWEPIARAEVARVSGILELLDEGTLPARKIPDPDIPVAAVIVDPASGRWEVHDDAKGVVDLGSTWHCLYCRWQQVCREVPAQRTPIGDVAVTLGLTGGGVDAA